MNELVVPGAVVHRGHALEVLRELPTESVHAVVTSPPYWGLRAYKSEPQTWGGAPDCEHEWESVTLRGLSGGLASEKVQIKGQDNFQIVPTTRSDFCTRCTAWRGELGLEPSPELFVQHIVAVFREVRRVLRTDGTAWVNFGDCYQGGDRGKATKSRAGAKTLWNLSDLPDAPNRMPLPGLKPKDMVGMPWRVAFALQADGWWLRSDIIWSKSNPMPESIRDRPTKSHEYLFLLAKSQTYYYDMDAIREKTGTEVTWEQWEIAEGRHVKPGTMGEGVGRPSDPRRIGFGSKPESFTHPAGRNKRSVWTIPTAPYPEAHFATFPEDLVSPCIKASTSEEGCCPRCGAPWRRVVANPRVPDELRNRSGANGQEKVPSGWDVENHGREGFGRFSPKADFHRRSTGSGQAMQDWRDENPPKTVGWEPTCRCGIADKVSCTVLEPFAGSGTTLAVAKKLGRRAIGIELQSDYLPLIRRRLERAALPLFDELDFDAPRQVDLSDLLQERVESQPSPATPGGNIDGREQDRTGIQAGDHDPARPGKPVVRTGRNLAGGGRNRTPRR